MILDTAYRRRETSKFNWIVHALTFISDTGEVYSNIFVNGVRTSADPAPAEHYFAEVTFDQMRDYENGVACT